RIPFDRLLIPVRSTSARVTAALLKRYGSAVLLMPAKPSAEDFKSLPHAPMLQSLHARKIHKPGDCFSVRVGAGADTQLLVVAVSEAASTFERLQCAGKWARVILDNDADRLLILTQGLDADSTDAATHALLAALEANVFRFASFKTKPRPAPRLQRID